MQRPRWIRVDYVHAVFFVDRLAMDDGPAIAAPFEEIVEPAGADDVDHVLVHAGTLRDSHLGLRDGAMARDLDRRSALKMQNADALVPAFHTDADEGIGSALKPRRHHVAVVVPDGAEALPVARIAP